MRQNKALSAGGWPSHAKGRRRRRGGGAEQVAQRAAKSCALASPCRNRTEGALGKRCAAFLVLVVVILILILISNSLSAARVGDLAEVCVCVWGGLGAGAGGKDRWQSFFFPVRLLVLLAFGLLKCCKGSLQGVQREK